MSPVKIDSNIHILLKVAPIIFLQHQSVSYFVTKFFVTSIFFFHLIMEIWLD